jgi:hypothetical protein
MMISKKLDIEHQLYGSHFAEPMYSFQHDETNCLPIAYRSLRAIGKCLCSVSSQAIDDRFNVVIVGDGTL